MTQQDIINELNRMVIGYNITWDTIKNDADRAIMKINAYLGAEFPKMSEVMLGPTSRYTINVHNVDRPIFPERYILTVVIPFIATEVLARDEEFTTIYNKYAVDVENGLFEMFQNEFNKVLPAFRQDPDVGVFFSKELDKGKVFHKNIDDKLLKIYFNVYYHFNEEFEDLEQFTLDMNKYEYKSTVVCEAPTISNFVKGIYAYLFAGWSTKPNGTVLYQKGDEIENITSDVHLYAIWNKTCVINITDDGVITIKKEYEAKVVDLNIPQYIDGKRVKVIGTGFTKDAPNLLYLTLPRTNLTIASEAIWSNSLRKLTLPSYDYLRDYPNNVTIETYAISCNNLEFLYIPYSVSTIKGFAISGVQKIKCEIESKPASWHDDWTETKMTKDDWGVPNG